ncbi:hypothetical protein SMC26_40265 [Actinomadura fulvescens]|uniref:Uncharacterized protein n=1 Tax=Actinomadura fulvescens TaxID=46160 RepID=A0ABN3Q6N2_9ACTN
MGTPNYPADWAGELNRIKGGVKDALTAARTRVKFARIAAAELVVGVLTGRRIVINPEGSSRPIIRFYPDDGTDYAEIWGRTNPDDPAITRLLINTAADAVGYSQVRVDRDRLYLSLFDAENAPAGGAVNLTRDRVDLGFVYTPTQARFAFDKDGFTQHYGRWTTWTNLGPQVGIFAGQVLKDAGSGGTYTDLAIGYGATLASDAIVVATIKNTAAQPPFAHYVAAESRTGFTVRCEGSHAFYANFWVFRS